MRLPEFIIANKDRILAEWQALANAVVTASCKPDADNLRRYASDMLDTLADRLDRHSAAISSATYSSRTASDGHANGEAALPDNEVTTYATARLQAGCSINQLVAEYCTLREGVLTHWAAHADALLPGAADDLVRFNRAIDQAIAASVARFSSISDHVIERDRYQISATLDSQAIAEASLRESEAKFRTIANAMPQMVWSALPDGFHDYYNQQWYDFTGVPQGSTDGDQWNGMFHPEDQPKAWEVWRHSLHTGETYEIEYRLRHRSGQYRWTLGRALPVRSESGEITRWIGTCTDIHEQKLAAKDLKEADQRKDELLAMLAHELRNPLAPVSVAADLLGQGQLEGDKLRQTSDIIGRQVRHMTQLVDDLLDLSRVNRGLVELKTRPVDMRQIIHAAVEQIRPLIHTRQQHLKLSLSADTGMLIGDEKRLVQVVGNLLTNAAKYSPKGGDLSLNTRVLNEQMILTVEDEGMGMPPELLRHVFELFAQAERTPDRSSGGLGLGLALVKRLVELHGGHVTAESEGASKGSRFTVYLPCPSDLPDTSAVTSPEEATPAPVTPLRIMVVDDNRDAAMMLAMYLETAGHQVLVEYESLPALQRAALEKPDVYLLDIGLPKIDGNKLAARLRADSATASSLLIAITGYGQAQDRQRSLAAGFDHYLVKPVDPAELDRLLACASAH